MNIYSRYRLIVIRIWQKFIEGCGYNRIIKKYKCLLNVEKIFAENIINMIRLGFKQWQHWNQCQSHTYLIRKTLRTEYIFFFYRNGRIL